MNDFQIQILYICICVCICICICICVYIYIYIYIYTPLCSARIGVLVSTCRSHLSSLHFTSVHFIHFTSFHSPSADLMLSIFFSVSLLGDGATSLSGWVPGQIAFTASHLCRYSAVGKGN